MTVFGMHELYAYSSNIYAILYGIEFMARNQITRISVIKYAVLPICTFVFQILFAGNVLGVQKQRVFFIYFRDTFRVVRSRFLIFPSSSLSTIWPLQCELAAVIKATTLSE